MCYLRSMEYVYCSVCGRFCHVRSKLRDGTDRFCDDTNEFTAHLCYLTRLRMVDDEQACREANERAQRLEDAEAQAEAARNAGRGRGTRRRTRRRRQRRVPEVSVEPKYDGRCDACEAVARGEDGAGVVQDYQAGWRYYGGWLDYGAGGSEA